MTQRVWIDVPCPYCGRVKIGSEHVTLVVNVAFGTGRYLFECPSCREQIARDATRETVHALRNAGVVPAMPSSSGIVDGPLTEDDLIRFGRELESGADPWVELRRSSSLPS